MIARTTKMKIYHHPTAISAAATLSLTLSSFLTPLILHPIQATTVPKQRKLPASPTTPGPTLSQTCTMVYTPPQPPIHLRHPQETAKVHTMDLQAGTEILRMHCPNALRFL